MVRSGFYRVFRYHTVDGGGPDKLAAAISDQTLVVTSNVTDRYPQLNMSDARSLLNKEVSLTYPDRGYHRRIAAIAALCAVLILKHQMSGVEHLSVII